MTGEEPAGTTDFWKCVFNIEGKKSAFFFKNKGAFLTWNKCFRGFLDFDNERMYTTKNRPGI